ncbi:hypothetical protein VPNG_09340 [Cytospora leucostoma]|uniref:NAD-specific glutamate dehydrogenase n=1 Tax=Cytospora leucostoma TaxID=1230097 RepID=A0A423VSW8_9PEZI|nr:hypothetical protein VPNG_09340 [Cytospora leucostoma]
MYRSEGNLQVDELLVVHLEEHTSDLSGQLRLQGRDLGEDSLTEELLLLRRSRSSKLRLEQSGGAQLGAELARCSASLGTGGEALTAGHVTATWNSTFFSVSRREPRNANGTATRLDTASAGESRSLVLDLLESGNELGVVGLVVTSGREVSRHAVHVGRQLLRRDAATAATLSRVALGELALTTSLGTGDGHAELVGQATTGTGWEATLLARSVEDRRLHEVTRHTGSGGLLHPNLVAGLNASLELVLTHILALSESDVQGLAVDHPLVHVGNGLGGIVRVAEAHETEALALAELLLRLLLRLLLAGLLAGGGGLLTLLLVLLVLAVLLVFGSVCVGIAHDLGRCDRTVLGKHGPELLVINIVTQVLDVQVDTLVLVLLLNAGSLVGPTELLLTLMLLLGTADIEVLTLEVIAVQLLDSLVGSFMSSEVDKSEATVLSALLVSGKRGGSDVAVLGEQLTELLVTGVRVDVLDIYVGEVGLHLLEFALAVLLGDVVADIDLLLVQKHAIDVLDSLRSSLVGLVVHETVSLGVSMLILGNLAAENVAESGESVMQSLVVDSDIEVLDEDVASAGLAQGGVTLGPHDTARAALDNSVVELLKSLLTITGGVVVHVCVAQGATGDGITANTDGGDRADLGEELEEHGFGDGGVELANVQRGGGSMVRSSRVGGGSGLLASELGGVDGSVDAGGGILGAVQGGVAEISSELVNSGSGGGRGSHFDL